MLYEAKHEDKSLIKENRKSKMPQMKCRMINPIFKELVIQPDKQRHQRGNLLIKIKPKKKTVSKMIFKFYLCFDN